MSDTIKYLLPETEIPKDWYNIVADLPEPPPPVLHPGTHEPVGPDDLAPLFPMSLIMQEVSGERYLEIPGPVRVTFTNSGGHHRCSGQGAWKKHSIHQQKFITNTKV